MTDGLPPALIERRFKQKGWEVGKNPKHDFCPECVAVRAAERRQRRNSNKIKSFAVLDNVFPLNPAVTPSQPEQGETVQQAVAESPVEMSRADRRIIFAKLEECYHDEDHGYRAPWTDQAVAKDLGSHIPVAWVAKVREENFGPVKDNADIRDMLARVHDKAMQAQSLIDEVKKFRADLADITKRGNDLLSKATDIGKDLHGLMATADRIHKAVS